MLNLAKGCGCGLFSLTLLCGLGEERTGDAVSTDLLGSKARECLEAFGESISLLALKMECTRFWGSKVNDELIEAIDWRGGRGLDGDGDGRLGILGMLSGRRDGPDMIAHNVDEAGKC